MSYDDMNVIACKILKYIYKCMRKGIEVDEDLISYESFYIPPTYWARIFYCLVKDGYLGGIELAQDTNNEPIISMKKPWITIKGVKYLTQNSFMKKTLKYIREAKQTIPGM